MDHLAQPQLLPLTGATAATKIRKISVPVGYKFSPTDEQLVNLLKRKLMNLPEQHCLIPEYNHYEADQPYDLIAKYNELSDGESNNDECFFFTTNRSNKRVHRSTPKGHWHETSGTKTIQGSDGVSYVMRYFTFKIGQHKNSVATAWRMREFTDPSNKELALCKIFKDVNVQKKKKDDPSSVIPKPSTSLSISHGSQTPEAYADMAGEARTPTSAYLTSNNLVSPQWQPTPFDETLLSDPNLLDYGMSAFCDQFLDFDKLYDQFSDPNLMKDDVISPHHQQPLHTEEGSPLHHVDGFSDFIYPGSTPDDEFNKDPLYPRNVTTNTGEVPQSKRPQMVEGTSLEVETTICDASEQQPMKKSRILGTNSQNIELPPSKCGYFLQQSQMEMERNFSSTDNSPISGSMSFPDQGNNMLTGYGSEEVNSEEVASLFDPPAQPRSLESSNHMESSQHQFQLSQPWNGGLPWSNTAPQQMDMSIISEMSNERYISNVQLQTCINTCWWARTCQSSLEYRASITRKGGHARIPPNSLFCSCSCCSSCL